jgi:hypothetical protein
MILDLTFQSLPGDNAVELMWLECREITYEYKEIEMKRKLKLLGMETTLQTIIYLCWEVKMEGHCLSVLLLG